MPVFTWTPDGSMKIQKGFGYYWSVTVSLTLIILMVWGIFKFFEWESEAFN
ncbi:hypothetical protein BofuT4_uP090030.1 [Botrytis cinerea T4]|uniref:Uncharacterized protein n=1 Tax=Botryotinia fuckeliana (strain T4) TaxID=999810 RepID=G2YFA9_BOTF4|nr:hypothetical protein BofuT4_uP090030.1 [Botrytis cinerea T4]